MRAKANLLALALVIPLVTVLASPALAHNPAMTAYEPAPLGEGVLVLGEEGTAALVDHDGSAVWTANLSLHVTRPPTVSGDTAATIARTVPEATPRVQAFDTEGPTWNVTLDEPGAFGFLAPTEAGFLAVSTEGRWLEIDRDGEVTHQTRLPFGARTDPEPAPGGGWVIGAPDRTLAIVSQGGTVETTTGVGGLPSDVLTTEDRILVHMFGDPRDRPAVQALDPALETQWIHDVDGLRVGGELALTDDHIVFGTYDPNGARLVALTHQGDPVWETTLTGETAAAVTAANGTLFVAVNTGVQAFTAQGEPLWNQTLDPRIASPAVIGDRVYPSGAADRLLALETADGSIAWSFTDGVGTVPWTDEQLASSTPSGDASNGEAGGVGGANDASTAGWVALAALSVAGLLGRRRQAR